MNVFEEQLTKLFDEGEELRKNEIALDGSKRLFSEKLLGFFKENGLPENFTLPELALLGLRKGRQLDA